MAFVGITCTEAEIDQKTGAGLDTNYTDVMKTQRLLQAESWLNVETGVNYSDAFAGLDVDVKYIITNITASLVAVEAIKYNFLGLAGTALSRIESEDRISVLYFEIDFFMQTLKAIGSQKFMDGV